MPRAAQAAEPFPTGKTLASFSKNELVRLCQYIDIDDTGTVVILRQRLVNVFKRNRAVFSRNRIFSNIYRSRQLFRPPQRGLQPNHDGDSDNEGSPRPPSNEDRSPSPDQDEDDEMEEDRDEERGQHPPRPASRHQTPSTPRRPHSPFFPMFNSVRPPNDAVVIPQVTPRHTRPQRVPGMVATDSGYLIPDHVRKVMMEGFEFHISFCELTDKACRIDRVLALESSRSYKSGSSKNADPEESKLSFDEHFQAGHRFLTLLRIYREHDYAAWHTHLERIWTDPNRSDNWQELLEYDIDVRRRSLVVGLDPATHQQQIYDTVSKRCNTAFMRAAAAEEIRNMAKAEKNKFAHYPSATQKSSSRNSQSQRNASRRCILCGNFAKIHQGSKCDATTMVNDTALDSTDPTHAPPGLPTAATASTYAASAEVPTTVPKSVLPSPSPHDFLPVITPLVADVWEAELQAKNLLSNYADVVDGIRNGFDMGTSPPLKTFTPNNHKSSSNHSEFIMSNIHTELSARRYSGPFSRERLEAIIGPFRSSPLGVVPKQGSDGFRMVQDFSFPRNDPSQSSVNSTIDLDNFNCDWGTFQEVSDIVLTAPPGAQAATLDVDSAFRQCPISPLQQPNFIVMWNGMFYIDHTAPFGASTSGFVFGRLADALVALLESNDIGPLKKWVDDFLVFRFPNLEKSEQDGSCYVFDYDLDRIFELTSKLGWPWKPSKTKPFSSVFKYLGFLWDLVGKSVQIPDDKKTKYKAKLDAWVEGSTFSLKEAESLHGTLVHCALAVPDGRSRLPALSRFVAYLRNFQPFTRQTPNTSVLNDVAWWRAKLSETFCGTHLKPLPPPSAIEFWVDASTDWGIGVIFDDGWDSWRLCGNWKSNGRNIGWAEFVAIELGLLVAVDRGFRDSHFIVHSDNQGVIYSIANGKSRSHEQNEVMRRISYILVEYNLFITPTYVTSASNRADNPSRGLPVPFLQRQSFNLSLPQPLQPFLKENPII